VASTPRDGNLCLKLIFQLLSYVFYGTFILLCRMFLENSTVYLTVPNFTSGFSLLVTSCGRNVSIF
jgi:hypothetical protein